MTPFGCFISDRTLQKMKPDLRDGVLKAITEATDAVERPRAGGGGDGSSRS